MKKAINKATENRFHFNLGDYIEAQVFDVKTNLDKYIWLYENLLQDEASKKVFFNVMAFRLTYNTRYMIDAFSGNIQQYFDESLINFQDNWTYVDCGGLDGKTVAEFIVKCPQYKNIYLYEPIPEFYNDCINKMIEIDNRGNIKVKKKALFNKNCVLKFTQGISSGSSRVDEKGTIDVIAVTLDDDIKEDVDFIKMDIEGSERKAIEGAQKHIRNSTPYLSICVYHLPDDLSIIPKQIYDINPNYNFFLRHHSIGSMDETVLYAIPKDAYGKGKILKTKRTLNPAIIEANCYKILYKAELIEKNSLLFNKSWILQQLENHKEEISKQNEVIYKLKEWNGQLEESKNHLLLQLENHKGELSRQNEVICELGEWIKELENSKNHLIQQLENYKEETSKQNKIISELKEWIGQLEENKKYLLLQLENYKGDISKQN
jgi:FkbM family methyltransferase